MAGCGKKSGNSLMALAPFLPGSCPELVPRTGVTVVDSGSAWIERDWHCYYLLKLDYDGKDSAYAMWIPPLAGGVKPAVVLTRPYDYIKWNGDSVPSGVPVTSNAQNVSNAAMFLLNGCGVLYVYERFQTGGSIQNDVDDTVAGLRFLNESAVADTSKIGIWGGSWGGFEALYGAAYASDGGGVTPAAGIAFFPPSDFNDWVDYVENPAGAIPNSVPDITDAAKRDAYENFFVGESNDRYVKRIKDATGLETWTGAALLLKLTTPFMVVHDEWDTLVPFEESVALAADAGITPLFFYQEPPRNLNELPYGWGHGELRMYRFDNNLNTMVAKEGYVFGIANTLASAYLFTRIAADDRARAGNPLLVGYEKTALNDFIGYIRDIKCSGRDDAPWAAKLLQDCADERVLMIEMSDGTYGYGDEIIAKAFSDANWGGTSYGTASTVRDALGASGGTLPDCP